MNIKGSPTSIELFGLQDEISESQDLFEDLPENTTSDKQQFATPNKKRPCFRSPNLNSDKRNELISPLSAAISNSVQGVYCSQEIKDQDNNLKGEVWTTLKALRDRTDVLLPYNIKNILQGKCLYRGKVAHISALVKSVESVSQKDTSILLHDNTGEIRAAVHNKVMEKYGSLLQPGVGLLLRQCTVFSFITVQKYVNITLPNIVHVYNTSSLHPDQEIIDKHVLEVSEINIQKVENPDTENQTPNITMNTPNRPPPPRPSRNVYRANTPQNNARPGTPQNRCKVNTPQGNSRANPSLNKTNPYTAQQRSGSKTTPSNQTPQKSWTPQRNRFQQNDSAPAGPRTPQRSFSGHNPQTPQRGNQNSLQRGNQLTSQRGNPQTPPRVSNPAAAAQGSNGVMSSRSPANHVKSASESIAGPSSADQSTSRKRGSGEGPGVEGVGKKLKTTPPPSKVGITSNSNISPKEQEEIAKLLEDIDDSFFDEF